MATAAVMPQPRKRIRRSRQAPKLVDDAGNLIPQSALIEASARFRARQTERISQRVARLPSAPDRRSVAQAMLMVEVRLVKAFWTIARQPLGTVAPLSARRNGIDYIHEKERDRHAGYKDAAGGDWSSVAPRPSLPSSKEIDAANEALDWLLLITDESLRRVLVVGATSKRGDIGRRIAWARIRTGLPSYGQATVRTLQRHYQQALRIIVTEMTIARLSSLSHKSVSEH